MVSSIKKWKILWSNEEKKVLKVDKAKKLHLVLVLEKTLMEFVAIDREKDGMNAELME